jgi:nucleoside-diphosphate kinase
LNELEGKIVSERSLVLVKPDGVKRGLIGEVLKRIETKGWKIVALELRKLDEKTAASHYAEHDGKPFFKDLISFITSSPLLAVVIEGPNAIAGWRQMMGATNPANALPGTIRGDFATETHGSDSPESAAREIALFFPGLK